MMASGVDPELLKDPDYEKVSPILDDYDKFDALFFGYTPREVSMIGPQQRLFMECCWEAFENAEYNPHTCKEPVGVFGGTAINTYMVACSTSLVSVHLSIHSLLNGECSMALAGGVAVWVPHEAGHLYQEGNVFTKDGHCRAFDAKATGTIFHIDAAAGE